MKTAGPLFWLAPLLLHASDALAWGLYTHMYFAQLLMWAIPLADPNLRRAVRRFPELCFAGACLPDISLISRLPRLCVPGTTHQWSAAAALLRGASSDEERAIAVGYSSHLLTDIVAHNYFVPAHETLWFRGRMLTHAASEWAMDAHVAPYVFVRPADLLERHSGALALYAGLHFGFDAPSVARGLRCLMHGERTLRASRLPQLVYQGARCADRRVAVRFDDYISETATRLRQLDRLVAGEVPAWLPEPGPQLAFADAISPARRARSTRQRCSLRICSGRADPRSPTARGAGRRLRMSASIDVCRHRQRPEAEDIRIVRIDADEDPVHLGVSEDHETRRVVNQPPALVERLVHDETVLVAVNEQHGCRGTI